MLKVGVKTHRATYSCLGLLVAPLSNSLIDGAGMLVFGDEPTHAWIYGAQRLSLDLSASRGTVGSSSGGAGMELLLHSSFRRKKSVCKGQFSPQNRGSVSSDTPDA